MILWTTILQVNCPRTYALSESLLVLNTRGLLPIARVHSATMTNISGTPAVIWLDTSDCHKKLYKTYPNKLMMWWGWTFLKLVQRWWPPFCTWTQLPLPSTSRRREQSRGWHRTWTYRLLHSQCDLLQQEMQSTLLSWPHQAECEIWWSLLLLYF